MPHPPAILMVMLDWARSGGATVIACAYGVAAKPVPAMKASKMNFFTNNPPVALAAIQPRGAIMGSRRRSGE